MTLHYDVHNNVAYIMTKLYIYYSRNEILFVCFVALCPKSTAMVMARQSVHLTALFLGQA